MAIGRNVDRVLAISPDIIKLDMTLTRSIDSDSPHHALAAGIDRVRARNQQPGGRRGVEPFAEL